MKKSVLTSSLIITTYNWKEALELVLKSVLNQSLLPTEVIIADDGSREDTKRLIDEYKLKFPVPLIHVWHEDNGFQKSQILNKAIAISVSEYIIQADGDCILHKNFIRDHVESAVKKTYLFGSRSRIKETYVQDLFRKKKVDFKPVSKGLQNRTKAFYAPVISKFYYKRFNILPEKLRGCNMSFWKADAISVNGYNEDIFGWGREDSEFVARLTNIGVEGKRIRYKGIVFHIYHLEESREKLNKNDKIQQVSIDGKSLWCTNGIDKYINNQEVVTI